MGTIHNAKRLTYRLWKVLDLLRHRGSLGATTREIVRIADVCAVNTCVAELRELGHAITCNHEAKGRFRYFLKEKPQGELF